MRDNGDAPTVPPAKNPRRVEVIRAAYSVIAEKGFEGLRTREVAERVGINSATLHYYFPSKEALIRGVVEYLMQELQVTRAPLTGNSALERLRAEFQDVRVRLKENPEQLTVLTELAVRSLRDSGIATMLGYLDNGWREHLMSIFQAGIAQEVFRPDLDVEATANAMMSQLRGLGLRGRLDDIQLDASITHMCIQMEQWVRKVPKPKKGGRAQ